MRLPESARERLSNYEGPLVSVEEYLRRQGVPLEKSRTISAYKAAPEQYPGRTAEEFLEADVPAELEAIVAQFEHGLRGYIVDQYQKKRNEPFTRGWHVAAIESIGDFWQYIKTGEVTVRVEPDQSAVANKYYTASIKELKEHMKTVADEYLLDYFRMQNAEEKKTRERARSLDELKEFYAGQ